jgi:hypothetical protein
MPVVQTKKSPSIKHIPTTYMKYKYMQLYVNIHTYMKSLSWIVNNTNKNDATVDTV